MRTVKLQLQTSIDGFITADSGRTKFNWDDEIRTFCLDNLVDVDCFLLGRKTAEEIFIHWSGVATNPLDVNHEFGKRIMDIPKVVFSKSMETSPWSNTSICNGSLNEEILKLKTQEGKSLMVYGGSEFAASLIQQGLIDEYYLLINPVAVGSGLALFHKLEDSLRLRLANCEQFKSGTVLISYKKS